MTSALFIPELGHLAMILALCFAVVQAVVPLLGAWRGDEKVIYGPTTDRRRGWRRECPRHSAPRCRG